MTSCDHSLIVALSFFSREIYEKSLNFKNFIAFSIVSKLTFYLILHFISIHPRIGKYKDQSKDNIALIVYIIPSASFFITTTLCVVSMYSEAPSIANIMISISAIMMMTICITTSWFYSHMLDKNQELLDLKIRAQREYDSAKYYKMLIHQDEKQRILIHDIKKHSHSLLELLRSEKYEDAEVYINNIINSKTLNCPLRKCDNDLLNALLYRYSHICSDNNIEFHVDVRKGLINFLQFNEMTTLFSNLMENAIEAAGECENRFVELCISEKKSANIIVISAVNSCIIKPENNKKGTLITKKIDSESHGYGVKSMKSIVEKYQGKLQWRTDKNTSTFHTMITIKKPEMED